MKNGRKLDDPGRWRVAHSKQFIFPFTHIWDGYINWISNKEINLQHFPNNLSFGSKYSIIVQLNQKKKWIKNYPGRLEIYFWIIQKFRSQNGHYKYSKLKEITTLCKTCGILKRKITGEVITLYTHQKLERLTIQLSTELRKLEPKAVRTSRRTRGK